MEKELQNRWQDVTSFVSSDTRDKWWTKIMDAYRDRPFRGLPHLAQMFRLFDTHKDRLKERYGTAFAIFFKNIVYDPHAEDNAEKSATLLREFSQETTFDAENYVADLILQSGSSSTDAHLMPGLIGSEDVHYLIDFDMAWLGDDDYERHEKAIRRENTKMTDAEYAQQRLKVLKMFLQVPNMFATAELRAELEGKARKNIENEIALLEKGDRKY